MGTRPTFLTRVAKLDDEIAALRDKLDTKLDARKHLLAQAIAEGESIRTDVAEQVRSFTRAANLVTNGRILTEEQVRAIRAAHSKGTSQGELARRYGLSQPSIHRIVKRLAYADVA